jgi:hypothetical protein
MSENEIVLVRREAGEDGKLAFSITEAGLSAIEKLAANGNADATIASALGINRKDFAHLLREGDEGNADVLEHYYIGKAKLADELTDILLTHARGGNVTAAIYLSKARLGWRDQGPATATPGTAVAIQIVLPAPMSDAEFAKIIDVKQVEKSPE